MKCSKDTCCDVVLLFAIFEDYKALQSSSKGEDLTHSNTSANHAPGASIAPREEFRFVSNISNCVKGQ